VGSCFEIVLKSTSDYPNKTLLYDIDEDVYKLAENIFMSHCLLYITKEHIIIYNINDIINKNDDTHTINIENNDVYNIIRLIKPIIVIFNILEN